MALRNFSEAVAPIQCFEETIYPMGWRSPSRKKGSRKVVWEILRRPVGVNEGECRGSEEYMSDLVKYARSEEMCEHRDKRRGRRETVPGQVYHRLEESSAVILSRSPSPFYKQFVSHDSARSLASEKTCCKDTSTPRLIGSLVRHPCRVVTLLSARSTVPSTGTFGRLGSCLNGLYPDGHTSA